MEENFPNADLKHASRTLSINGHPIEQARLGHPPGLTIDPQGLDDAGHEKQQSDLRIRLDVAQAVDPVVARPIRQVEKPLPGNLDKARRIAPRRRIATPVAIGGRQNEKRRRRDETRSVDIDMIQLLGQGEFRGRCIKITQGGTIHDC